MPTEFTPLNIACQQVLQADAAVYSHQEMTVSAARFGDLTAVDLLERYLQHIRHFTYGLVRPVHGEGTISFCLSLRALPLLTFTGPLQAREGDAESVVLRICGGLLVQPDCCDRGELSFRVAAAKEGVQLAVVLSDYCPLLLGGSTPHPWRKGLYRFTQAAIHKLVTVRFLKRLYRERAGRKACCRVVKVSLAEGEEI